MTARANLQRALIGAYALANRYGWLDSRVAESVFHHAYFTYKRLVEDPFAKLTAAHPELFRGGDVIDVGANIGYTATVFARAIDRTSGCKVHAFEPDERNFRWLERAIDRGGLADRVVAHRIAVGSRDGMIELWHNASHHADHRIATDRLRAVRAESTHSVPITSIDRYLEGVGWPAVSFVKIDVQGYEPEVLRGMQETIARTPRLHVAVEWMPSALAELGFDPDAFLGELARALPHLAILDRTGSLRDADLATIQRSTEPDAGYVDLVCRR